MPAVTDCRDSIAAALTNFASYPLPEASRRFFAALGYQSDRTVSVRTAGEFRETFDPLNVLTVREGKSLEALTSLHFLFQLTDTELTSQRDLLSDPGAVENTRIHSYLFFAAELPADTYTRTFLSGIARAINKPLPMPALVLLRHGDALSLAILHRRLNRREADRDVLEKATLIKDIRCADPIRAHLEILNDFVLTNLDADFGIHNFVSLHQAWQKRLGTFALNDKFYSEIADWFFWAQHLIAKGEIVLPRDVDTAPEQSLFLIRLLTRLIFCWFLLEKRLLPADLFREHRLKALLKDFGDDRPTFYRAVLQNLFFGVLNQPVPERGFRAKNKSGGLDPHRGITSLWRYEDHFRDPAAWRALTGTVPFLNGGLFDCLDRKFQRAENQPNVILDGFSDNPAESSLVPNFLFFDDSGRTEDLSVDYGESDKRTARSKRARVRGLIQILSRYKFTIEENTPLDEEIALDPELLGKVFENLLAAYNPETRDTARKQTGSFYTPREVVSFMVDEALLAYLEPALGGADPAGRLRALLDADAESYDPPFDEPELERLVLALDEVKILDPACGSGAFPMGALGRLVDLLRKLDPKNQRWEVRQKVRLAEDQARAAAIKDPKERQEAQEGAALRGRELAPVFNASRFDHDYARKLFLIENAIFGADIQPIAVQIAKLRFFIALISDQKPDPQAENQGVLPLPNLETRLVAANSLLPVPELNAEGQTGDLFGRELDDLRRQLREVRHDHFAARSPATKRRCRERDAGLRGQIMALLKRETHLPVNVVRDLAAWDPYDQNDRAPFFDPAWMFGTAYTRPNTAPLTLRGEFADIVNAAQSQQELAEEVIPARGRPADIGFDIVIGNPPYVRQEKIKDQKDGLKPHYPETYSGTADLYVYFYDRALQLLRPGGILSYITSNKWYRAAYGEKLRAHLGKTTTLLHAIDFGDAAVFTAIAYPTIVIARKAAPLSKHTFRALNWEPETPNTEIANFAKFYEAKSTRVAQNGLSFEGWRFLAKKGQDLLDKISAAGTPLGKFTLGRFYYGIKTGFNEAFVVDKAKRDELIFEHESSAELLKPFLRGRDVKRWRLEYENLWVIFTRHGTNLAKFPAIKAHLSQFQNQLEPKPRDWSDDEPWKGRKPGSYKWFEMQDNVAYWREFEAQKIIIPCIEKDVAFAIDRAGFYSNDKTSIIATDTPEPLCAVLNSKVHWWYATEHYPTKQGGFVEFKPTFMANFPVPKLDAAAPTLTSLARILAFAPRDATPHPRDPLMRDYYEELLNALVYELYLPEELHAAGLQMFERVAAATLPILDVPTSREQPPDARLLIALRDKFEELYKPTHPLRAALQKLHTLESVRIIEGKV